MSRTAIPFRLPDMAGPWWEPAHRFGTDTFDLKCPFGCDLAADPRIHSVDADGNVSPSIVCPNCPGGWHVFVRLESWPTGPKIAPLDPFGNEAGSKSSQGDADRCPECNGDGNHARDCPALRDGA